jgi:hypothetical protein
MDILLRRNCSCLHAQKSSRHHMQTPPRVPCMAPFAQQLQSNSSLQLRGDLCIAAAGNVQAMPVLKSGEHPQHQHTGRQLPDARVSVAANSKDSVWQQSVSAQVLEAVFL